MVYVAISPNTVVNIDKDHDCSTDATITLANPGDWDYWPKGSIDDAWLHGAHVSSDEFFIAFYSSPGGGRYWDGFMAQMVPKMACRSDYWNSNGLFSNARSSTPYLHFFAYENNTVLYRDINNDGVADFTYNLNYKDGGAEITATGHGEHFWYTPADNHVTMYQRIYYPASDCMAPISYEWNPEIANQPPVVEAGLNQTVPEGTNVAFSGSFTDPDSAGPWNYSWDFGNGNWANGTVFAEGPLPTEYCYFSDDWSGSITLFVTDEKGATGNDTMYLQVYNVDPHIKNIKAEMEADFTLRIAGEKWHNADLTVYSHDPQTDRTIPVAYVDVERWPGSPDRTPNSATITLTIDLTKKYYGVVTYDPYADPNGLPDPWGDQGVNGQLNGANPVWVDVTCCDEDRLTRYHHTFNTQQTEPAQGGPNDPIPPGVGNPPNPDPNPNRASTHWNHVDPWVVDFSDAFVCCNFSLEFEINEPGSDDIIWTIDWDDNSTDSGTWFNDGVGPDPLPSHWYGMSPVVLGVSAIHHYWERGTYTLTITATDDDGGVDTHTITLYALDP
jgi:hypothetical protein